MGQFTQPGSDGIDFVTGGKPNVFISSSQQVTFHGYATTAVTSGITGINPTSTAVFTYTASSDTVQTMNTDGNGQIVSGDRECTITLTRAQLIANPLTVTMIQAPGAGKYVVVNKLTCLIRFTGAGSGNASLDLRQPTNQSSIATVARLPAANINNIMNQPGGGSGTGIYVRNVPLGNQSQRNYRSNQPITLHRSGGSTFDTDLTSISFKISYRMFDQSTF